MPKVNVCLLDNFLGSNNKKNTLYLTKELEKEPHITQELSFSKLDFKSLKIDSIDAFIWDKYFGEGQYRVIITGQILDQELKDDCRGNIKDENYDCFIVVVKLEIEKKDNVSIKLRRLLRMSSKKMNQKDTYFISECISNLREGEEFLLGFLENRGHQIENGFESFRDASRMIEDLIKHLSEGYLLQYFPFDEYPRN